MSTLPASAANDFRNQTLRQQQLALMSRMLPPAPLPLATAYRQSLGLAKRVPVEGVLSAAQPRHRLAPYDTSGKVVTQRITERACDTLVNAAATSSDPGVLFVQSLKLPRAGAWGRDAVRVAMNHFMTRWAEGALSTQHFHKVLGDFHLSRPQGLSGLEFFGPKQFCADEWDNTVVSPLWAEQYQFVTMERVNAALSRGDVAGAAKYLKSYIDTLRGCGYYGRRDHRHYGALGYGLLSGALRALEKRAGIAISDSEALHGHGLLHIVRQREIPHRELIEIYALHMNPTSSIAATLATPLFELLQQEMPFPASDVSWMQNRLCDWAHGARAIELASMVNHAPCLTAACSPEMQAIERIVESGIYVLRAHRHDPHSIKRVATHIYHILSRDELYSHLGFFSGTRLAMGMLADAQRWTDGPPQFTSAIGGYGALLRSRAHDGGDESALQHPAEIFDRFFDPFHVALEHDAMLHHVHAYISAAAAAGHFTEATATNMQHSVIISEPNHRAAAIVVHGDGEDA